MNEISNFERALINSTINNKSYIEIVNKVRKDFRKYFNIDEVFGDAALSGITGKFELDIIRFDEYLKVPDEISTKEFIIKEYSIEAMNFIKGLMDSSNDTIRFGKIGV